MEHNQDRNLVNPETAEGRKLDGTDSIQVISCNLSSYHIKNGKVDHKGYGKGIHLPVQRKVIAIRDLTESWE